MANWMGKMASKAATNALVAMGAGFASMLGGEAVKHGLKLLTRKAAGEVDYVEDIDLEEIVLAEEEPAEEVADLTDDAA